MKQWEILYIEKFKIFNCSSDQRIPFRILLKVAESHTRNIKDLFLYSFEYLYLYRLLSERIVKKVRKDRRKTESNSSCQIDVATNLLYCSSEERKKRHIRFNYRRTFEEVNICLAQRIDRSEKFAAIWAKIKQ